MTTRLKKLVQLVPRTKPELEAMVKTTIEMQTEREKLVALRDAARLESDKPFAPRIAELDAEMARNLELVECWAEGNRVEFGENKSLSIAGHTIGWRLGNWKTSLIKKTRWNDVIMTLTEWKDHANKQLRAFGNRWVRVKIEADKEALIADRADNDAVPLMRELGVEIVQEETFYLSPDREGQNPALLTAAN